MNYLSNCGKVLAAVSMTVAVCFSPVTFAASANDAVEACKVAIAEEQGSEFNIRLVKINARGSAYEAWFNLSKTDDELKSYCKTTRDRVANIITSEGQWSRKPKTPESA